APGILCTADPVTGNRKVASVEASFGLGEALVSGLVNGDVYKVRDGEVVAKAAAHQQRASHAPPSAPPQDIERCLADDGFQIFQSRPITTLFPIPESGDRENHVYVSVGHQQMMTDPMKPLGLSFWQTGTPAPTAEAGGRLFVDVTQRLASPTSRAGLLELAGGSGPLAGDATPHLPEGG